MHRLLTSALALVATGSVSTPARAAPAPPACPPLVSQAALKAYEGARIQSCKEEREHDRRQFEVKLETKGRKLEVDVTPEGAIIKTEEVVELKSVPAAVMSSFAARYAAGKPERAEKQTAMGGKISYEIAFHLAQKRHEATFGEDGAFLEEE